MSSQAEIPGWAAEAQAHLERAQALYEQTEQYEEALQECDAAIELDPDLAEAHNLRGVLLEELDRPLEALKSYGEALRVNPRMEEAADNLRALEGELDVEQRLVTVARTGFPATAEVLKGKLEAAGIPAVIIGAEIVQTFWPQAMGGIQVQVREQDREAAVDVLDLREEWEQLEAQYWEDAQDTGEGSEVESESETAAAERDATPDDEEAEQELAELTQEAVAQPPEDDPLAQDAAAAPPPPQCPQCGSSNVRFEPLGFASRLGMGLTPPTSTGTWACEHCGYGWEEGDGEPSDASE